MNIFSRIFVLIVPFLILSIIPFYSIEDRSQNPLYKALPSLDSIVPGLLEMNPAEDRFLPISFRNSLAANWFPTEDNFFQDMGIQIAENRFNAFCMKEKNDTQLSIPRKIHLIWMGSKPTPAVFYALESWKRRHPNWEIKLWTEKDIETFSWSSFRSKSLFISGRNWAEKSDILRFEILYQFGGIYSDTDVICLKSFEDLVKNKITFFAGLESNKVKRFGRPLIGSAIIGAAPGSTIINACIDFTQSIDEAPHIHQHIRSGPGPITKASYQALEHGEDILILPCSYFYPLPWEKRLAALDEIIKNIRPESFAIHLWEGSWFDSYHPPKKE